MGAMTLTGDPRRWANEPGLVGVVRYPDTHRWGEKEPRPVEESLQGLEDVIRYEGPHTIAAVFLETIVGTNGILIPPDGYLQGVREICDRHGILMVCDEVMAGFGRTGHWFAVDHWGVVPDLMTMAKGLTSSYLPLGAVAMRHGIAEHFETKMFFGGLTYSSHPVSLAAALATIRVYEEDDLITNAERLGPVMRAHHERLAEKHPSVGACRNLGLFGIIDLVRSREPYEPLTPFNGTSDEMKAIGKALREAGLYTMIANNSIHTNPPLCITEAQLAEGFEIIDRALDIADEAVGR
jgi:taurine--2-oxoglutarate transaminase